MADGGSGGGDGGNNETQIYFDGDQSTSSTSPGGPPPGDTSTPPPNDAGAGSATGGGDAAPDLLGNLLGDGGIVGNLVGDSGGGLIDSVIGSGKGGGLVDVLPGGGTVDGLANSLLAGGAGDGLVDSLLGSGEGKGVLGSLLGGDGLVSATADAAGGAGNGGDQTGLSLSIGGANGGGASGHDQALIDVNADISLQGNGDGASALGSVLNGHGLLDANVGADNGSGDALVNVNADAGSVLGGSDGPIGSLLGNGDGVGDLGSLLNGQQLLNVDAGSGDGNSDALVNVHADPGDSQIGTDGPIGSLLGNGDSVGDLGSVLDGQHLLNMSPAPSNGSGDALVNVDTSGADAANILGGSGDMGLVAALVGADHLDAVDLPIVDTPQEVSVLEVPVADIHLQPDHA